MIDVDRVIQTYATETEDGRIFFVHSFANEDFHMMVRDEEGVTNLGRFDSLAAAQAHVRRLLDMPMDA